MKWLKKLVVLFSVAGCGVGFAQNAERLELLGAFTTALSAMSPSLGAQAKVATKLLQDKCGAVPTVQMVRAAISQPEVMPPSLEEVNKGSGLAKSVAKVVCE